MAKMDDEGMYELICKDKFKELIDGQNDIINLLRGKNGNPGLLDDVRTLKRRWKVIYGTAGIVSVAAVKTVVAWIATLI